MGVITISDPLVTQTPTDALGNTGRFDVNAPGIIWSFTFFNNSARTMYILMGLQSSKPVKVPASTSFDMTVFDLMNEDLKTITWLGTSGDTVTAVVVHNPVRFRDVFLGRTNPQLSGATKQK